jgi:hypothetical protein
MHKKLSVPFTPSFLAVFVMNYRAVINFSPNTSFPGDAADGVPGGIIGETGNIPKRKNAFLDTPHGLAENAVIALEDNVFVYFTRLRKKINVRGKRVSAKRSYIRLKWVRTASGKCV